VGEVEDDHGILDFGFGILDLGFWIWDLRFGIWGLRFAIEVVADGFMRGGEDGGQFIGFF
jgi:hypothetical protein